MIDVLLILEEILKLDIFPVGFQNMFGTFENSENEWFIHEAEWKGAQDIIDTLGLEKLHRFLGSDRVDDDPIIPLVLNLEFLDKERINLKDRELGTLGQFPKEGIGKSTAPGTEFHDVNVARQIHGTDHLLVQEPRRRADGPDSAVISQNTLKKSHIF